MTRKAVRDFTPGQLVLYSPSYGRTEAGMVVRSNDDFVFVRYADGVKATRPEDLIHAKATPMNDPLAEKSES